MKTMKISAEKRTDLGKKQTRDLRKADHVPCVMYGGPEVLHFHAHENDFRHVVYTPNAYIVELDIDGEKHKAVMKDLQFHPVNDKLLHLDFVEVFDDKLVTLEIPLKLVGDSEGILDGGKPRQRRRVLKVRGLVADLPEVLEVDITNVATGDVIKVGDLTYDNIEVLDPSQSMVYAVVSSRISMKGMEIDEVGVDEEVVEGAEGAEGAEGESSADDSSKAHEGGDA